MAADTIVGHLAAYLAAQGIGRLPGAPGVGARPWPAPLWRQPADGTPEPGTKAKTELDDGLVVGLFRTGEITQPAGIGYSVPATIDAQYRGHYPPEIEQLAAKVRGELAPAPYGIRDSWVMDGVGVIQSRVYSGLAPIESDSAAGFTFRETYLIEVYADYTMSPLANPESYAVDVGDGATVTFDIAHQLATTDVEVTVYDRATGAQELADVQVVDANTVAVTFDQAPAAAGGAFPGGTGKRVIVEAA